MMLMRDNLKKSIFQSVGVTPSASLDLSLTPKQKIIRQSPSSADSGGFVCGDCGRTYKLKSSLRNHQKWECGKEPQFQCPYCVYKAKQKMHMARHMERMHREIDYSVVKRELKMDADGGDSKDGSQEYDGMRDYSMIKNVTTEMKVDEDSTVNTL
ncbi:longitudinals lacking protein-like [Rhynchophorus ferrugineus]